MKSRRDFLVSLVLSCIFAETLAISAFSRHDEGTIDGLTTTPSISTTTQQLASTSSTEPGEQFISSNQDSADSNSFIPSQYAARQLELEPAQHPASASSSLIKILDAKAEQKETPKSPVTAPRMIKFIDSDEVSPPLSISASAETKKNPRSYYGEFASHSQPFTHTSLHSREQTVLDNQQHVLQQQQQVVQQPQHVIQQHYPVQVQDHHYNHASVMQMPGHGHGHASIPYLPDAMNEISGNYPVQKEQHHYQHVQESHYPRPPIVLSKGKHIRAQVALETPPIVYQPGHNSGVTHSTHGKDNGPYFGPAFSKALKFWIPSAIFLTGVSALFPQRVKVFTNEQDEINSRPKRSTRYSNGASEYESIPAVLLRREHRSDHPEDGGEIHDYEDLTDPYYQHAEPQRIPYSESLPKEEIESFRKSIPLAEIESYQGSIPKLVEQQFGKILLPSFVPMPESSNKDGANPYLSFDFLQTSEAPTTGASIIPAKSTKEPLVQKTSPKPSSIPKVAGTPKPTAASTKQKVSPGEGRKVFVVVRSNAVPAPTTTGATFPTAHTTVGGSTPLTTRASPSDASKTEPTQGFLSTNITPTVSTAGTIVPSARSPKFLSQGGDPVLVTESQKNSVSVQAPIKSIQNQKTPNKYDLSPDGPVIGLLSSVVEHNGESLACQKRALCELAIRGTDPKATRFETFMWSLATLVPDAFTFLYDLEDVFKAIREKKCPETFPCQKPNLDIQE